MQIFKAIYLLGALKRAFEWMKAERHLGFEDSDQFPELELIWGNILHDMTALEGQADIVHFNNAARVDQHHIPVHDAVLSHTLEHRQVLDTLVSPAIPR